jgi:hypothetical protein
MNNQNSVRILLYNLTDSYINYYRKNFNVDYFSIGIQITIQSIADKVVNYLGYDVCIEVKHNQSLHANTHFFRSCVFCDYALRN